MENGLYFRDRAGNDTRLSSVQQGKSQEEIKEVEVLVPKTVTVHDSDQLEFDDIQGRLYSEAAAKYAALNPGNQYLSFGFITDVHHITPGTSYDSSDVQCERNIKMMGTTLAKLGVDAAFFGGDMLNYRELTQQAYYYNRNIVVNLFDQYFKCPVFYAKGNHDKNNFAENSERVYNAAWHDMIRSRQWGTDDIAIKYLTTPENRNSFAVDFKKYKVRIVVNDVFPDTQDEAGNPITYDTKTDTAPLYDLAADGYNPAEWIIGSVQHDAATYGIWQSFFNTCRIGGGYGALKVNTKCKGVLGMIYGHIHQDNYSIIGSTFPYPWIMHQHGYSVNNTSVRNQYGTEKEYCFSIFIVDTDNMVLHMIRVGRGNDRDTPIIDQNTIAYAIKSTLTGCSMACDKYKSIKWAYAGDNLTFTLTPFSGKTLTSVTVTMSGVDVTASVYADGIITVPNVTGEMQITAVCE